MHTGLTATLVAEHHRDLKRARAAARPVLVPHRHPRVPRGPLPRYRLTWSRTTLGSPAGGRPVRSWVIVISATRAL